LLSVALLDLIDPALISLTNGLILKNREALGELDLTLKSRRVQILQFYDLSKIPLKRRIRPSVTPCECEQAHPEYYPIS
jgi:hypothetical protein